jgi:hypothetical protein
VKVEVWHREVLEVVDPFHVALVWAERESDLAVGGRVNLLRVERLHKGDRLESELDATLFIRHSRGVKLTPPGEVTLAYAKRVLQLVDDSSRAVKGAGDEAGTVRIGSMETTAAVRLADNRA